MSSIIALAMENILYLLLFPLPLTHSSSTPTPFRRHACIACRALCTFPVSTLSLPSPVCVCESTNVWLPFGLQSSERARRHPLSHAIYSIILYIFFIIRSFLLFPFCLVVRWWFLASARAAAAACRFNIICAEKFGVKRNRGVAQHIEWMNGTRQKKKTKEAQN